MSERRRGWTQSEIQFIKDNNACLSLHELSSRLGRSYGSISSKIYKLGLDDPRCWTKEEDEILIANYEFNPSIWELLPNRSRTAISQRAQSYKLSRHCGNYHVNYKFFDSFTEKMAYVLGFFIADGCVEPKLKRFSFSQREEDVDILYKIRKVMDCHNPLCFKKTRNEVNFYIHNKYMVNQLQSLGFDNHKTFNAEIPNISQKYLPHLIRGILDGDGSIYTDGNRIRIQFLGTLKVLSKIREYFLSYGISSNQVHKRKVNVHILGYGKRSDVQAILKLLYKDATIYLDRKYKTAMEMLDAPQGAFARGVIPRKTNLTQNEESLPDNAEANLVGKTGLGKRSDWPVEDTRQAPGRTRMMECSDTPRNRR